MRPPSNEWPSSETETSRGVLFFAQHMREMLTQTGFESFRVATLDLLSKLRELIAVSHEVGSAHLPIIALQPVLEECARSLNTDPIVSATLPSEAKVLCEYIKGTDIKRIDISYVTGFCKLLLKRLEVDYSNKLEEEILGCYSTKNSRDRLKQACAAYCAHLINSGYNRDYLLSVVDERFFQTQIKKVEKRTLQRFFSSLPKVDRLYRVWIPAPKTTANFLAKTGLDDIIIQMPKELPSDVVASFQKVMPNLKAVKFITTTIRAKDPRSAALGLFSTLSSVASFIILGRRDIELVWDDTAYVRTSHAQSGSFVARNTASLLGPVSEVNGSVARSIRSNARRAFGNFDEKSTERILSAVNTAALARSSPNPENQLISLWSAIEVLLSNPPASVPRIVHYVDLLAPCICHRYVRRYIVATFDGFVPFYRNEMDSILRGMPVAPDLDQYSRFTQICFDPGFKSEQSEMLKILTGNPLALYRLWKLEKNFASPNAYCISLRDHEQRVRWHLHRIYRTRNQLVHNGADPVYLEPLVLNMLEYFRSTIAPLFGRSSREADYADVDQLVTEIGIEYQVVRQQAAAIKSSMFAVDQFAVFYR